MQRTGWGSGVYGPSGRALVAAPILDGNRVDVLLNGEQTFPAMLEAIRGAKRSITYAQYLYQDGAIAEHAHAEPPVPDLAAQHVLRERA
mgnify:CR=1 FL=1